MKRKTKVFICLAVVAVILVSAVVFYYFGATYPQFDAIAEASFEIPGLETKFVPQGLEYDANHNIFLVSGYMSDGESSRIYVTSGEENAEEKYFTLTINGEPYKDHAGGIAVDGDHAWVVGDKNVYRFNYKQALLLENGEAIEVIDGFVPGNGADFVLVKQGKLIVGEFYKKDKYDTLEEHHITISESETNYAMAYIYTINQNNECGVESKIPEAGISLPNQVQGMNFTAGGDIVLSTSYSIPDSKILIYQNVLDGEPDSTATINEKQIPVYTLAEEKLEKTITAPAMSEELVLAEGKLYLLFESNCAKYRMVNRTRISNVFILDI